MASHSKKYTMFSDQDKVASQGVKSVAETGGTSTLKSELAAAGKNVKDFTTASSSLFPSNNNQSKNINGQLEMDVGHRTISSISMVAPSPDWFTGLSNYRPVKDGKWLQSFSVDTYPWDAGTDSGTSYTSGNSATNPKERVYRIFYDLPENNVFIGKDGSVLPVGQWSCDKVKETECREDQGAKFFQKMKDGKLRTKKCRWLAKKIARKNRFCSKISTNVYAPSAGDVCRVTCETCPSISTDDD